jgi:hypothetical protein
MLREALHWLAGFRPLRVQAADVGAGDVMAPLFERYFLCEIPRFVPKFGGGAVYLHHYLRSDPDRGVHDHPWDHALAVQLCAGYIEERWNGVSAQGMRKRYKRRRPGFGYLLKGSDFHRVLVIDGAATSWSLFAHGPYRKQWGFLSDAASWQRLDATPVVGLLFRPFQNENAGSSKWWKDRTRHPPGRKQKRADPWGIPTALDDGGGQQAPHAARVAFAVPEDLQ